MTSTATPSRPPDMPPGPDHLAGAVLSSLVRPLPAQPWGATRTLVLGVLSFGILPLIIWPLRLRDQIVVEQQRLWHLAEWMRLHVGQERARELTRVAEAMRFSGVFWLIIAMSLLWLGLVAAPQLGGRQRGPGVETLVGQTYRFGYEHYGLGALRPARVWGVPRGGGEAARGVFLTWTAALCLGYLAHWLHVRSHADRVVRFVAHFNVLAQQEHVSGFPPDQMMRQGMMSGGFSARWIMLALVLAAAGAWWGVPMALAGAMHRHHFRRTSPVVGRRLAESLREMLRRQRPWMAVPMPVRLGRQCPTQRCPQVLPPEAQFCPRCGTRVAGQSPKVEI